MSNTSFKQFLQEKTKILSKWESESLPIKRAIDLLNLEYKDGLKAIANGQILFRGDSKLSTSRITFIDTTNSVRTSKDTNNLYNIMMDASSEFSGYPSRLNSITVTNNLYDTSNYSRYRFVIFPKDGTRIAISKIGDFIEKTVKPSLFFPFTNYSIAGLNLIIEEMLLALGYSKKRKYTDVNGIDSFLSDVQPIEILVYYLFRSIIKRDKLDFDIFSKEFSEKLLSFYLKGNLKFNRNKILELVNNSSNGNYSNILTSSGLKMLKYLSANSSRKFSAISSIIATPETLGVSLKTFAEGIKIADSYSQGKEMWLSGKIMAIPEHIFKSILEEMKKQKMKIHPLILEHYDL